jgi:hypothetical protein
VLIPARNEESNIADALHSVLRSSDVDLEVIVMDDGSTDTTADIVRAIAAADPRVRLVATQPLPDGWCGKPFACHQLSALASHSLLLFMDADVRVLRSDSLSRLAAFIEGSGASLVSGVPHEETETLMEKLVIPLIHFVLLGFLPLDRMRESAEPRFAAGCGQLIAVRRGAYSQAGGHAAIEASRHDGIALSRSFRSHGIKTDLFDATDTVGCRMYRSAEEVWSGFAKNADEGLGSRRLIVPATFILFGGQILPLCLLLAICIGGSASPFTLYCAIAATAAAFLPRIVGAARFRQSLLGVLLHPVGVGALLAIQWFALARSLAGRPATWKNRAYTSRTAI